MSADNWDECPRCKVRNQEIIESNKRRLEQGYGQMSQEEWLVLKEQVDNPAYQDNSLKEYYEQGLMQELDGTWKYYVRYYGRCTNEGCGFEIKKAIDEEIQVEEG